ncbi:MAG: hypothetical protein V3R69_07855 [candidate division NC10 bacterium]
MLSTDVQIGRGSMISGGGSYSAVLKLHNRGKRTAYDATVLLDGWPGHAEAPIVHPLGPPGYNEYEVTLAFEQDAPIRTTPLESPHLRIRYRDGWQYWYEIVYPVVQTRRDDGSYNIRIEMDQGIVHRPKVGFFRMQKHLREAPGPMSGTRS